MSKYKIKHFPKTRIATIDICELGNNKHYIPAFLEIDISDSRAKIKKYKKENGRISFTAWLIKVISHTIKEHENVAAYLKRKRKLLIFENVNVSIIVKKKLHDEKIPVPLLIEKANEMSIESITKKIQDARNKNFSDKDVVLHEKSNMLEKIYFSLPGFLRRTFWKILLKNPQFAFSKMGNVSITSIGMISGVNGWFIPISIHPVCFGVGKISKKAIVVKDKIEIREILNLTVLMDHDVIDGAPMARFITELTNNLEKGVLPGVSE